MVTYAIPTHATTESLSPSRIPPRNVPSAASRPSSTLPVGLSRRLQFSIVNNDREAYPSLALSSLNTPSLASFLNHPTFGQQYQSTTVAAHLKNFHMTTVHRRRLGTGGRRRRCGGWPRRRIRKIQKCVHLKHSTGSSSPR